MNAEERAIPRMIVAVFKGKDDQPEKGYTFIRADVVDWQKEQAEQAGRNEGLEIKECPDCHRKLT